MMSNLYSKKIGWICFLLSICMVFGKSLFAQTDLSPYVIFGGQKDRFPSRQITPLAPGYGVQIGPTNTFQGGSIGSYHLVKSTGNLTLGTSSNTTNIHSWGIIQLVNSNVVTGKITAANQFTLPSPLAEGSTILSIGSSAVLGNNAGGDIDVRGSIVIGGGSVLGKVTIPNPASTYTYSGPVPAGGPVIRGTPTIPTLPVLPDTTDLTIFSGFPTGPSFSTSQKIRPNISYGNITLNGNKTVTFDGPGVYIINSIKNSGTSNNFVFNFKNKVGNIRVYVRGNVDLGKIKASLDSVISYGGGPARAESRIYLETLGKGISASNPVSFSIANGSAGNASKWVGTVYAPFAAINVGSGTGSTNLTGALWSGTQVNLQSGISMVFAPFTFCDPPNINVGPDRPLDFSSLTTLKDSINIASSYSWRTIGGIITSDTTQSFITVSSAGTYILKASSASNCFVLDTIIVTSRLKSLIGSELQSIYDNKTKDTTYFVIADSLVMIDVIVNDSSNKAAVQSLLQTWPYRLRNIQSNGESKFIITGDFPVINLPKLNFLFVEINYCRPHYQAVTNGGLVTSAGDTSARSYLVRKGYNLTGQGNKIGVISNSYNTIISGTTTPLKTNTASQDTANGDLPGVGKPYTYSKPVKVLKDLVPGPPRSDEGRAMAQIIHDLAPGADLYFHTGSITAGDFAVGIKKLRDSSCNIIVDDLTYITEPFLKDGVVANAVDEVKASGVTYFSAAGNFGSKSYEKNFLPVPAPTGFPGTAHDFGGGDKFDSITLYPGPCTIVLQWADSIHSNGQGGTKYDLDMYLTTHTDGSALFGFNRDNTLGDPIEFIPFTVLDTTITNILVVNNTTSGNPSRIKIIVFRGEIKFHEHLTDVISSTVVGQTNALGAIAIGAARYHKTDSVEYFSSTGGTFVNGVQRNKPDLTGPDGVNTTVNMGPDYPSSALDGYSNFFGTSAAAPHAAAIAALIMEGRKKFIDGHPVTSPDEIRALLDSTAKDIEISSNLPDTKFDFKSGFGFINVDMAMRTFAAPTPSLDSLLVPVTSPSTIPGDTVFTLTVKGENFSSNSIIYIRDSALASTLVLDTINGIATAVIPKFTDNPPISIYTPPRTAFGDGGFSDSLYFFDADIVIKAVSDTIKYGQILPALDTIITINGVLLKDTMLTLADLGLSTLILTIPEIATNPGNVGTYTITPSTTVPIDISLLVKYNYEFIAGALTIEKLPVTITAMDTSVIYGDQVPNIEFTYSFDNTNIANPAALLNMIETTHQNQLARDAEGNDILGLVNGKAVVIENGKAVVIENGKAIVIENGQAFLVENGINIPVVNAQALTIENGIVTDTSGIDLTPAQIANLSFLTTTESLNNSRTVNSTTVIDITQESILDFNVNAAQTYMLSSVSDVHAKGLVDILSYTNAKAIVIENGKAVVIENGFEINIVNGKAVVIENGQAVIIENGQSVPIVSSQNRTAVIVDSTEIGDGQSLLKSLSIVSGLDVGEQFIIPGSLSGSSLSNNFDLTYIAGQLTVKKDTITITAEDKSRQFADPNPELTVTYSGFAPGEDLETSGITGAPVLSTSATLTSSPGTYPITVSAGNLASSNYAFKFVNGTLTITVNPCLLTRAPFNNFGSTPNPQSPTSLWVNVETKVSGQLKTHGRYLLFTAGTITLNDITAIDPVTNTQITTKEIPSGKIIADSTVSAPVTHFDIANNKWITRVPVDFSSTSDIFMAGAIINSSNGFVKKKNNANSNTVVKGIFYSDTVFSDQWTYALATYRPIFDYASIADTGQVIAINGTYRAGTPTTPAGTPITTLVNGGSGGGGNNYTGSTSSFDNFTACPTPGGFPVTSRSGNSSLTQNETWNNTLENSVQIIPNPASDYIILSFVPAKTGNAKIVLYTIDGRKIFETDNGIVEAGLRYMKKIDVSKLNNGIYLVQLWSADKLTSKKIIISQ